MNRTIAFCWLVSGVVTGMAGSVRAQTQTAPSPPAAQPSPAVGSGAAALPQPTPAPSPAPASEAASVPQQPAAPPPVQYVLVPVQAVPAAEAPDPEPTEERPGVTPGWAESRVGVSFGLLGPNSLMGGALAYQPVRWVELQAWGGYASSSGSTSNGAAYAEAKLTTITGLARARIWPMQRHSVIFDTGVGVTHYSINASGRSYDFGSALDYQRKGSAAVGALGAGWGYRSNSFFRVALVLGAFVHVSKLDAGTMSSSSDFSATEREDLRQKVDDIIDRVTPYFDASVGFLF